MSREALERLLLETIVPFWYPQTIDESAGGYRLNHDHRGRWRGPAPKRLVTQARVLWFFSRLATSRYGEPGHLEAARHGFRFLRDRMWDERFGGFWWEVDAAGSAPAERGKHLYAQAFALYALARYALASREPEALALSRRLFGAIETHAHDVAHGGYAQAFSADWKERTAVPGMDEAPNVKTTNTHLHLLEAIVEYHRATADSAARERLAELILIVSDGLALPGLGVLGERYAPDWTPLDDPRRTPISFGHNLEAVTLLADACESAGIAGAALLGRYRTIVDYALAYGFDRRRGGFFASGLPRRVVRHGEKVWWVQAEALWTTLAMYQRTGEERYGTAFTKTLDWIVRRQADWRSGEWHARIGRFRTRRDDKAGRWKGPYHAGRALIACLEMLDPTSRRP